MTIRVLFFLLAGTASLAFLDVSGQSREASALYTYQNPVADEANDTLGLWQFRNGTQTLYASPNGGFAFGTNGFNDLEKARSYSKHDTSSVDEVLILAGAKTQNSGDPNSHISVVIYRPDTIGLGVIGMRVGAPGTELGRVDVPISDVDTTGGFTVVDVSSISVDTTTFIISIDLSGLATGDTIGLVSTTDGDAEGDESVWERHNDGSWVTMLEPNIGWDLDCHPGIFCILNTQEVGVKQPVLKELAVWPNPSNSVLNVSNPNRETISLSLIAPDSKSVFTDQVKPGSRVTLDVSGFAPGVYLLRANTAVQQTSKLIIIH